MVSEQERNVIREYFEGQYTNLALMLVISSVFCFTFGLLNQLFMVLGALLFCVSAVFLLAKGSKEKN